LLHKVVLDIFGCTQKVLFLSISVYILITLPISMVYIKSIKYILCTGASLYAPYSLLLISNKFWMGGERVWSQWGRSEGAKLEGANKRGGVGWLSSLIHMSGPRRVN
jgi:hypothetical protein